MRLRIAALLFGGALVLAHAAWAAPWPSSCGDPQAKFDVSTKAGQPLPAPPAAGMGQIVFIEDQNQLHNPFHPWDTVRFAMNGAWVGADKGNSYFTLDIAPGTYHLCASWQGVRHTFDLAPVTVEPGKVHYFAAKVTESQYYSDFRLVQLNDDQGEYRVKAWKRSVSKPVTSQN